MRLALATAVAAWDQDIDLPPLLAACSRAGIHAEALAWDDPTVAWSRFDAVLLRSTWDYTTRLDDFLDWCGRVEQQSALLNPLSTVRWNIDKHYLRDLAQRGVPVVPTDYLEPGAVPDLQRKAAAGDFVVKPCVGAGSRDARRFRPDEYAAAEAHAQMLLDSGRSAMLQPYLAGVDSYGETALIHIGGRYSHAIRKGPLLHAGAAGSQALFAAEDIQPRIASDAEHAVAERALAALPELPVYARVDLLPTSQGPVVLELELVEPSLFFEASEGTAERLLAAVAEYLHGR